MLAVQQGCRDVEIKEGMAAETKDRAENDRNLNACRKYLARFLVRS